jgi:hypothetical protein
MRTILCWTAAAILGLWLLTGIPATTGQAGEVPCTEEIRKFCADVQPGGGRIVQCLRANEHQLSMACMQRVKEVEMAFSGPMMACREDWVSLCTMPVPRREAERS